MDVFSETLVVSITILYVVSVMSALRVFLILIRSETSIVSTSFLEKQNLVVEAFSSVIFALKCALHMCKQVGTSHFAIRL